MTGSPSEHTSDEEHGKVAAIPSWQNDQAVQPVLSSNMDSASAHTAKDDKIQDDLAAEEAVHTTDDASSLAGSELPQGRQLGIMSAVFLMSNRIVGTGVFATTSTILQQSGSVGMSLLYWVIGAVVAFAGFYVYGEFASAMPRNGGELNYLQHVYRRPRYLVASMYAAQALLLGQAAGNAYTAGQYFIRAGGHQDTKEWAAKGIGVAVLVSALLMHGTALKWGLRFQNALGMIKFFILLLIAFAGFAALAGHTRIPKPDNFTNAFEGSRNDIYGIAQCIYNAGWSYVGYSNLFYAVGEVHNPLRAIKWGGPIALLVITILYELVQIAYFAAVPKEEVLQSKQIIAALFFKNVFGESSARALSVFVALSAVANVYAVVFSQGRLNQALGRDGLIPLQRLFATNRPFKAPLAGLAWHVVVTLIIMLAPPAGDAYNFVLNLSSYPLNVVNSAVGLGLLSVYLPARLRPEFARKWNAPLRATWPVALFYTLVSMFLVVVPWISPKKASDAVYEHLWYALAPAVSIGIFAVGAVYWAVWYHLLPWIGGYTVHPVAATLSDGTKITKFEKHTLH